MPPPSGLSLYAKLVVFASFALVFIGGLVTSSGAGMAVPDWPLSFGTLDPSGWWANLPVRLEHGHRQAGAFVGLLIAFLGAMIWRYSRPLLWCAVVAPILSLLLWLAGVSAAAIIKVDGALFLIPFTITLVAPGRVRVYELFPGEDPHSPRRRLVRRLALFAFLGVVTQGVIGGLRVTTETAGNHPTAMALRIVHGCVAQAEVCLVVALATMLSPRWQGWPSLGPLPSRFAWITAGVVYLQLIVGAVMRHLGAGLAIPTYPAANPNGGFMPKVHGPYTDTNFTHTRFLATVVTVLIVLLAHRVSRAAEGEPRLTRPAWVLLALVLIQFTLGVLVIWHGKPITLTTFHVLNGAFLLATTVFLALRLSRASAARSPALPS